MYMYSNLTWDVYKYPMHNGFSVWWQWLQISLYTSYMKKVWISRSIVWYLYLIRSVQCNTLYIEASLEPFWIVISPFQRFNRFSSCLVTVWPSVCRLFTFSNFKNKVQNSTIPATKHPYVEENPNGYILLKSKLEAFSS